MIWLVPIIGLLLLGSGLAIAYVISAAAVIALGPGPVAAWPAGLCRPGQMRWIVQRAIAGGVRL
ncbi:hypothetical protein EJC49_11695 [Aquibium carbonis]|uniref:Uncharacterized protein n=1 Tax=Aquibium carbonis TaxID=2495581 RepID=A0A3R9YF74_9HYPH|nr:hypothetical protein [Aquibium carbonis]RST86225.1 hypothetical protein EJC49_11695 [Aquibium carbonis]